MLSYEQSSVAFTHTSHAGFDRSLYVGCVIVGRATCSRERAPKVIARSTLSLLKRLKSLSACLLARRYVMACHVMAAAASPASRRLDRAVVSSLPALLPPASACLRTTRHDASAETQGDQQLPVSLPPTPLPAALFSSLQDGPQASKQGRTQTGPNDNIIHIIDRRRGRHPPSSSLMMTSLL